MSRPTESEAQQVREGTEMLKDIAEDVETEREKSSGRTSIPSDEAEEAAQPPLEDPEDAENVQPEDGAAVPVHPPARPMM